MKKAQQRKSLHVVGFQANAFSQLERRKRRRQLVQNDRQLKTSSAPKIAISCYY